MNNQRRDPEGVPRPEAPTDQPAGGNIRQLPRRPEPDHQPDTAPGRGLVIEDLAEVLARVRGEEC